MKNSNLSVWLAYLEQLHPSAIDMGLERIQQVAVKLKLTRPAPIVITVTGTNGKGSTSAFITQLLANQGLKVGLYTSPHLLHYQERIAINNELVTETALCNAFDAIEKARGTISLTYFEFGTLAALILFQQANLDAAVLEVGLGGRLDAVNIVDADIAVVTSIGIDHQEWLGNTRDSVALEKAGIFRPRCPAVCGDDDPPPALIKQASQNQTPLFIRGREFRFTVSDFYWHWQGLNRERHSLELSHIPLLSLPLANAAVALQVYALLGLPWQRTKLIDSLQQVKVTGRLERHIIDIKDHKVHLMLDVGHNPHAANFLAQYLVEHPIKGKRYAVFSLLADKDLDGVVTPLLPLIDNWAVAPLTTPRSNSVENLANCLLKKQQPVTSCESIAAALTLQTEKATPEDEILVFGSFHVVSDALLWLKKFE